MTRLLVLCAVVGGSSLAHAGPPEFSHTQISGIALTGDGMAIAGIDNCDEGGQFGFVTYLTATASSDMSRDLRSWPSAIVATRKGLILAAPKLARSIDRSKWIASDRQESILAMRADGDSVIAVGMSGAILRTTDAGATWTAAKSGTSENLHSISGAGGTLYAVGDHGTVLVSSDAGVTWAAQASGTKKLLRAVWASSAHDAIAVGSDNTVLYTHDGKKWRRRPISKQVPNDLTSVWGDGKDVYAGGTHLLVSHDAGETWKSRADYAQQVVGRSADDVYASGWAGQLLHSSDRGETWKRTELFRARRCR
jgi:photosystem II stability/assembly factor-like uncharacterized protein